MRRTAAVLALALVLPGIHPSAQPGDPDTARAVAERIEQRDTGRDSRMEMAMRLFDRQGRLRERTLLLTALRGTSGRGDRVLLRFLSPGDIRNTALLVWEHPAGEDERFLYLPALGRVRRIAGAERQESFAGSDLSYEDLGGRELDDYTYAFVERSTSWTGPDGIAHPAWRIESRATDPSAQYPRTVSLVRKDTAIVVSADLFNRRDEREKRYSVRRLDRIDGIWTATQVEMANDLQRTRTELVVTQARYNVGLSESDFSRRALEQGAQ